MISRRLCAGSTPKGRENRDQKGVFPSSILRLRLSLLPTPLRPPKPPHKIGLQDLWYPTPRIPKDHSFWPPLKMFLTRTLLPSLTYPTSIPCLLYPNSHPSHLALTSIRSPTPLHTCTPRYLHNCVLAPPTPLKPGPFYSVPPLILGIRQSTNLFKYLRSILGL